MPIQKVIEIVGMQQITPVPKTPDHMRGVINLRGIIHPVVDLNKKFGMQMTTETALTCIIIIVVNRNNKKEQLGMIVDSVSDVEDIKAENIDETPNLGTEINTNFIMGMAKTENNVKMLLDLQNIFSNQDLKMIEEINQTENRGV